MVKQEDKYADINGYRVRYWSGGKQGRNIILIHGIGGSVEKDWMYTFGPLSERSKVFGLDLLGFGLSDKPNIIYSIDNGVHWVKDFMDAVNIDRATLVGLSMGGGVALKFAVKFPERLEKLVIVDSACLGRKLHPMFRIMSIPVIGRMLMKSSLSHSEKAWITAMYDPAKVTKEIVETDYKLAVMPGYKRAFLRALRSGCGIGGMRPRAYQPVLDRLVSIKKQTLIVWGKQDSIIPVEYAYIAKEKIQGSQMHVFEKCGHVPPLEYPEEFVNIVSEFVSK